MAVMGWSGEDGGVVGRIWCLLGVFFVPSITRSCFQGGVDWASTINFLRLHDDNTLSPNSIPSRRSRLPVYFPLRNLFMRFIFRTINYSSPAVETNRRSSHHASQVSNQEQSSPHPMSSLTPLSPPPSPDPNHHPRCSPISSAPCTDHHACSSCSGSKTERNPAPSRQGQLSLWR